MFRALLSLTLGKPKRRSRRRARQAVLGRCGAVGARRGALVARRRASQAQSDSLPPAAARDAPTDGRRRSQPRHPLRRHVREIAKLPAGDEVVEVVAVIAEGPAGTRRWSVRVSFPVQVTAGIGLCIISISVPAVFGAGAEC